MTNTIKQTIIIGTLTAIALACTACGQKGALYLPQKSTSDTPSQPIDDTSTDSHQNY